MSDTSGNKIQVLTIGLKESSRNELTSSLSTLQDIALPYDLEQLMEAGDKSPSLILCGVPPSEVPVTEVAQTLRMNYPSIPMYLVAEAGERLDRKTIVKNGFTDIFFLPLDLEFMLESIQACTKNSREGVIYRSVKLVDLHPETVLDFDTYVYLPANNKHIKYSSSGQAMESHKIEKLKTHKMGSVFVSQDDMPKFHEYTAQALRKIGDDSSMSQTERSEKLRAAIRDIITGLFSDVPTSTEEGRRIVSDCQNIVKTYLASNTAGSLYERILALSSDSEDSYSHISNVSTFAVLFALALGLKTAEEISLAALLHDVGMSSVPLDIQRRSEKDRAPAEQEVYQKHPEDSVALIKDRKLVLPDLVFKIILQHHERFDGTGYPKRVPGNRLCVEAQVLSFADRFDEVMSVVPGQPRLSPADAVRFIKDEANRNPGRQWIEPDLLRRLFSIFPESEPLKPSQRAG